MSLFRSVSDLTKSMNEKLSKLSPLSKHGNKCDEIANILQVSAILGDHDKIKDILTTNHVDINVRSTSMMLCIINEPNNKGNTPLHLAVKNKHIKVVKTIIKYSVNLNINAKNNQGNTPLHLAALNNDLIMISILINYGADKYTMNDEGETPYNIHPILDETSSYIMTHHSPSFRIY